MDMKEAIKAVTEHQDLSAEQMSEVMRLIMTGHATPAQIGGFLIGLRMKGETVDEIAGAAIVMHELATRVEVHGVEHLIDTCGTGGDSKGSFNISTAVAFVVAAAGGKVAKHGNRSVSSGSGSADVLELAGVNLVLSPEQVGRCVEQVGVGFLFAPRHHAAMKYAVGPRQEMGVRTIFNLLGPLTNPAGASHQLLGVYNDYWLEPMAAVLRRLGSRHVLVVHAEDGMDELSLSAPTRVSELADGEVRSYTVTPEQLGFDRAPADAVRVGGVRESLETLKQALSNQEGAPRDIVALNGGAALYAADLADSLEAGVERAREVLASGAAMAKLEALIEFSNEAAHDTL